MKKTKTNIVVSTSIVSEEELESRVGDYARAHHRLAEIEAEINLATERIRAEYETEVTELKKIQDDVSMDCERWATAHPEEFSKRKSKELLHGVIGFRTGTPRCTLRRGTDEDRLAGLMLEDEYAKQYVRRKLEVDKQSIIAEANKGEQNEVFEDFLMRYGMKVSQTERFYIEAKGDSVVC